MNNLNRSLVAVMMICLISLISYQSLDFVLRQSQPQVLGDSTTNHLAVAVASPVPSPVSAAPGIPCDYMSQLQQRYCTVGSTYPAASTPTLTPMPVKVITLTPTPSVRSTVGANLIISDIQLVKSDPPESPCSAYYYRVYVKNIGTANAPKSTVKVLLSPTQPQSFNNCTSSNTTSGMQANIPNNYLIHTDYLAPGQTEMVFDYFNPSANSTVSVTAVADFYNNVPESNEQDNVLSRTFPVLKLWPTAAPASTTTHLSGSTQQ